MRSYCAIRSRACGFTLIELMAVVVVIAILAVIALPAYMDSVRKSRRAEAVTLLNRVAQEQERWRANNPLYTTDRSASGINVADPANGYYALSIASATASGYVATAVASGVQTGDAKCTSLSLTLAGGNITYGRTGTGSVNQCWNR
jgi:type IV pilus assembly protein PilE